ncbi:MAG: hypothetical protein H7062_08360 [Candidatus Saccharimonas sp.]|nr:hypothetical protein [Planctomycetaceae bacterium]
MNDKRQSPAIATAVYTTGAALLDLAVCLGSIANLSPATQSTQMPLITVLIFSELMLIALAVFQWVHYFRGYLDFRIDQLRQEQQSIVSQPPPAPEPAID